jgi:hypothetical protein
MEYPGEGYNGTTAYGYTGGSVGGEVDSARIYWKLGNSTIPETAELYSIEFHDPDVGGNDSQPIESMFNGTAEPWPIEPDIPWSGNFGVNHQALQTHGSDDTRDSFVAAGPGPQAPESEDYYAGPNGTYMWLKRGSRVFATWDVIEMTISRAWSVLRITQVTGPDCDFDSDGDIDLADFGVFQVCFNGPNRPVHGACSNSDADHDEDGDVDLVDFSAFQACFNGPNRPPGASCTKSYG